MRAAAPWILVLGLVACARHDAPAPVPAQAPAPTPASAPVGSRAAFIPTQAELDRFRAEGPEPTLRKIAAADYWLHYKLMQATGIEKELGGEEQAVRALKSLGEAYEKEVRGVTADAPR